MSGDLAFLLSLGVDRAEIDRRASGNYASILIDDDKGQGDDF